MIKGFRNPLAEITAAAVAQLDGLAGPSRGPRRHRGPAETPIGEKDLDFDGGISPRVEDLARLEIGDLIEA